MIEIPEEKRGHIVSDLMPDLTPLLDVMFMLIVFFLLTANAAPYALDVNLPKDEDDIIQAVEDPNMLSISLLAGEDGWKINDAFYQDEQKFKETLKEQASHNKKIIIVGDKDASMQKLLTVLTFLRKHDIEAADIVMDK